MTYRAVGRVSWRFEFKPADCWIGGFTKTDNIRGGYRRRHVWVCVVPMLPLHLWWMVRRKEAC